MMVTATGPQPDFEQMAQATATLTDNFTKFSNLPAIEGSAAILASLQRIEQRMERIEHGVLARYALTSKAHLCSYYP
jgi:hypothetical protein